MAEKTDYASLQRLSACECDNERTQRVDALATALAKTRELGAQLPRTLYDSHRLIGEVLDEIRQELRYQINRPNPFTTTK